jgi:hypothetical protein
VGKPWVLDTETKGTGAHMVPLEDARRRTGRARDLELVDLGRPPQRQPQDAPPQPLLFKVVNVMTAQVLAEGVQAREAVRALQELDSVLDARIFVWNEDADRWRLLSLDEAKAIWAFRGRVDPPGGR